MSENVLIRIRVPRLDDPEDVESRLAEITGCHVERQNYGRAFIVQVSVPQKRQREVRKAIEEALRRLSPHNFLRILPD